MGKQEKKCTRSSPSFALLPSPPLTTVLWSTRSSKPSKKSTTTHATRMLLKTSDPKLNKSSTTTRPTESSTPPKIDAFNALSKYYEDVQSCDTNGRFLAQSPLDLLKGYFDKNELELWTFFFEVTGKCFSDVGAMLNFVQIYELDPSDEQQDVIIAIIEAYYGRGTYELCKDVPYIVRELLTNN